jgi:hypothetical protein
MSKSNAAEVDFLNYVFLGTRPSWDAATDLYIALHTANPGDAGDQTTSEATYTGYARKSVPRDGTNWLVTSGDPSTASNKILQQFVACTGGTSAVTYFSVGTATSGAGKILYSGQLSAPRTISDGIQAQFGASTLTCTED